MLTSALETLVKLTSAHETLANLTVLIERVSFKNINLI